MGMLNPVRIVTSTSSSMLYIQSRLKTFMQSIEQTFARQSAKSHGRTVSIAIEALALFRASSARYP